jgi:hypothetical protein
LILCPELPEVRGAMGETLIVLGEGHVAVNGTVRPLYFTAKCERVLVSRSVISHVTHGPKRINVY